MAEHHTCDRCGEPIEDWLLAAGQARFVWVGRSFDPVELNLPCLNAVETTLYGSPQTYPPAAAPEAALRHLNGCLSRLWRGRGTV